MEVTFGSICPIVHQFRLFHSAFISMKIQYPISLDCRKCFKIFASLCVFFVWVSYLPIVFSILCIDLSITYISFVFWVTLVPYCWCQWIDAQSDRHTQRVRSKCDIWKWLKWHFRTKSHFQQQHQQQQQRKKWRIYFFFGTKAAPYVYHNDWLLLFLLNAFSVGYFFFFFCTTTVL